MSFKTRIVERKQTLSITIQVRQATIIIGSDGNDYQCLKPHTSASTNKPITGANWTRYWQALGTTGNGVTWVTATAYDLTTPYDVTGKTFSYNVKDNVSDTAPVITAAGIIIVEAQGTVGFTLTPTLTDIDEFDGKESFSMIDGTVITPLTPPGGVDFRLVERINNV